MSGCEGVAPSMWHILAIGWFMDVGRCEGVAPSMWHMLVRLVYYGWREIWESCAIYVGIPSLILANGWELRIYVPKRQLDVEKKIWGETSAEDCKKLVIFRDIHGATDPFWMAVEPSISCILHLTSKAQLKILSVYFDIREKRFSKKQVPRNDQFLFILY